jgi:3-oxoacyl-[acyl-carrier-protein] synthase-3
VRPPELLTPIGAPAEGQVSPRELRTAHVAGVGHALPAQVIGNEEIAAGIGVAPSWIERRTGIHDRRRAADGELLADLGADAARSALESAGLAAADVDLVLVATITGDEVTPSTASQVARALGVPTAGAVDIGAACSGFVSGLALGGAMIEAGRADTVVVVGAEMVSRVLDYDDKGTASLFGDGAGAAVLTCGGAGVLGPTLMASDGTQGSLIRIRRERGVLEMDGHETFLAAIPTMAGVAADLCSQSGIALADVSLFVFHQANGRILKGVAESLDLDPERVVDCIAHVGNTSAASVAIALSMAADDGRIPDNGTVVLAAFGAGLSWAGAVLRYGDQEAA